jgi:hypothetical protein
VNEVDATALFVTETVAGTPRQFYKLTRRERADIKRRLLAERRAKLEANLKAGAVPGESAFAELEAFDDNPPVDRLWIQHVNSEEGREEILRLALKSAPDADAVLDAMPPDSELSLVVKLCGLQLVKQSDGEQSAGETAGPNAGTAPATPGPGTVYGK